QLLPAHPQRHPALHFVRVQAGRALQDHGARVLFRLQQPRYELNLVDTDELRGLFEAHEDVEPVRDHILELLVPGGRIRFPGQLDQLLPLRQIVDAVELEQVSDVAFLERDPAEFHPADLGSRGANVVAGVVARDARALAQPPELSAEQHPEYGWTACGSGAPRRTNTQRGPLSGVPTSR